MSKKRPSVSWVDPTIYRSGAEWIKSTQQSKVPRDGEFIHAEWSSWREPPRHGAFGPSTDERHTSWCGVRLRLILAEMFESKGERACPLCLWWMKCGYPSSKAPSR